MQVPSVDISEASFDFLEGVHVGCVARLPFTLANATSVPASEWPHDVKLIQIGVRADQLSLHSRGTQLLRRGLHLY
jgi:hypothetical protein